MGFKAKRSWGGGFSKEADTGITVPRRLIQEVTAASYELTTA